MIRLTVPGQPQGKQRAKIVKIGGFSRMATPSKTVAYEGLIAYAGQIAMAGHDLIEGPVLVRMFVACQVPESKSKKWKADALAGLVFPTTKPDIDNTVKAVFDGLNGVVWKDDVQVVDLQLTKRYSATPRVEVEIVPIGAAAAALPARAQAGQGLLLEAVA
jgi:Holliday junction resolvase RusA-like endonuclease